MELTYSEVGATRGVMPTGYHHVDRRVPIGRGRPAYRAACAALMSGEMHRGSGLSVKSDSTSAELGSAVALRLGPIRIPCRVVYTVDEADRAGFAYGTLPGHPERGEELFLVEYDDSDTVYAHIRAFSRPGRWFTRLGAPAGRVVQRMFTDRYIAALKKSAMP